MKHVFKTFGLAILDMAEVAAVKESYYPSGDRGGDIVLLRGGGMVQFATAIHNAPFRKELELYVEGL